MSSGKSKLKKKKWAKGQLKDKKENLVVYTQGLYDKVCKEIPKSKVITISGLSERYAISGSLARKTIRALEADGLIKRVAKHSSFMLYTSVPEPVVASE